MEQTTPIAENITKYYSNKDRNETQAEIDKRISKCKKGDHVIESFFDIFYCKFCHTPL